MKIVLCTGCGCVLGPTEDVVKVVDAEHCANCHAPLSDSVTAEITDEVKGKRLLDNLFGPPVS